MGVIQQLGYTQQGKFASDELADAWLGNVKGLFQLAGCEFFLLDQLEDVLMQIGL